MKTQAGTRDCPDWPDRSRIVPVARYRVQFCSMKSGGNWKSPLHGYPVQAKPEARDYRAFDLISLQGSKLWIRVEIDRILN